MTSILRLLIPGSLVGLVVRLVLTAGLLMAIPIGAIFGSATTGDQLSVVDGVSLASARDLIPLQPTFVGVGQLSSFQRAMLEIVRGNLSHLSYGMANGGRMVFAAERVDVPGDAVLGTYVAVFQISLWVDKDPKSLGPLLYIDGPSGNLSMTRSRFCTPNQIYPAVAYNSYYETNVSIGGGTFPCE